MVRIRLGQSGHFSDGDVGARIYWDFHQHPSTSRVHREWSQRVKRKKRNEYSWGHLLEMSLQRRMRDSCGKFKNTMNLLKEGWQCHNWQTRVITHAATYKTTRDHLDSPAVSSRVAPVKCLSQSRVSSLSIIINHEPVCLKILSGLVWGWKI